MRFRAIIEKTYSNISWRAGLHLCFWVFIFASNYYLTTIFFNSLRNKEANYLLSAKDTLLSILFYYPCVYYVFPQLFFQKKYIKGSLAVLFLLMIYGWLDALGDKQIINNCRDCVEQLSKNDPQSYRFLQLEAWNIGLAKLASLGLIYQLWLRLSLPVAIKIGRNYFKKAIEQLQLSKENLQLEFNFLKAQVNPHFLFNTLNNIYSMVLHDKKEEATATIARLSDFMRYTLYECNDEKIQLGKEIKLIRDYIALEQIRLNQTVVVFNYTADRKDYYIPPLLFMPPVENAFKYVADHFEDSFITIEITVADRVLRLSIQNNFDAQRKNGEGGIGLDNMKRRLQHYFPGNHSYSVSTRNNIYSMELTCLLS